jgi:hypothetical protein
MSSKREAPTAVVVYESMFQNTEKVAGAIVRGLRATGWEASAVDVRWASQGVPDNVDLVVLGAPTHAFSLSRPTTRADAVRRGASPGRAELGLREWLTHLPPATDESPAIAVFDTRISKVRRLPTSAARAIVKLVRRQHFQIVGRTQGFLVVDVDGPLCEGEVERALDWGSGLGRDVGLAGHRSR